jgi:hypothetical protein
MPFFQHRESKIDRRRDRRPESKKGERAALTPLFIIPACSGNRAEPAQALVFIARRQQVTSDWLTWQLGVLSFSTPSAEVLPFPFTTPL